jgi:inosose dehydratase
MSWKYAVHSIAWGDSPLETILAEAGSAGYSGVELFQHPDELGGAAEIIRAFNASRLQLVGIASGSFDDRCRLVRELARERHLKVGDPSLPYVYADEWRENDRRFRDALDEGFRIGLHPHMYKPVQTLQEAEAILRDHPRLGFLPDTAHLSIAGDDPARAIARHADRLLGVHLKDWQEDVGRSYQFYARGFCELGDGDVDLGKVLKAIPEGRYSGWLVVEQDSTTNPFGSVKKSLQWLDKQRTVAAVPGSAT